MRIKTWTLVAATWGPRPAENSWGSGGGGESRIHLLSDLCDMSDTPNVICLGGLKLRLTHRPSVILARVPQAPQSGTG